MSSRNKKVKSGGRLSVPRRRLLEVVGGGSCIGLSLLGFLAFNPVFQNAVYAEEDDPEAGISTQAITNSTVTISFSPTSGSASMTPVDSNGAKAKVDVKATVRVQNSGGYYVYVGSSSSQLKSGTNTIDSVSAATTYANLPVNRWGYAFVKGTTVPDTTTYGAMPATLRGTALDSNTSTNISDETRTYMLSFAANIGSDKPAGLYTNRVTMSVVSSPLDVVFSGIDNLQDMTSSICSTATIGDTKQLKDIRDGKYYWVAKLADNNCWMTQNLDLDLSTSVALTPATSDVVSNWTPGYTTATVVDDSTISAESTSQRSWSLGDYRIANPTTSSSCGAGLSNLADCRPNQVVTYTTPTTANGDENAHYIFGNYYQWSAAVAGTRDTIVDGAAIGSICPKGWRLPPGNGDLVSRFGFSALAKAYSISSGTMANITSPPLYFVRGGYASQDATNLLADTGDYGYYWSSSPYIGNFEAPLLKFGGTDDFNTGIPSLQYYGASIRCVAR